MAALSCLCFTAIILKSAAAYQPHIVFFLADDYGFADIGYHVDMYGNSSNRISTPHLDKLAHSGIRLENYYIQPVCSPTRATLLTGRYVHHHGIHVPLIDSSSSALPLDENTMAQRLKSAGYATHMVGKWHLGFRSKAHVPEARGFDTFFGYYAGSQDYWNHESLCWPGAVKNGCFEDKNPPYYEAVTGLDLHSDGRVANSSEYSTVLYTDKAQAIIRAHAARYGSAKDARGRVRTSKPLFLYLPHQAVHVGNSPTRGHPEYALDQAPQPWIERYSWVADEARRNLSAMVGVMDEAAGNVTRALAEAGLWDDTLFVFSTDNGGPVSKKASNYPLKGGKGTLWEGGVRGIGFVAGGDLTRVGIHGTPRVSHALTHISDWNPTLCDVAGGCPLAPAHPLDGVSAWPSLQHPGVASGRKGITHDYCVAWMGGSCLEHLSRTQAEVYGSVFDGTFKLVVGQNKDAAPNLYNLSADPSEQHDLSASQPQKLAELLRALHACNASAGPAHDRDPIDPRSNPQLHGGVWVPWE